MSFSVRDAVEFILKDESEEFAEWAIGPSYNEIPYHEWPKYWNRLHSDKLELLGCGKPIEDIPKMIDIWRQEKSHE